MSVVRHPELTRDGEQDVVGLAHRFVGRKISDDLLWSTRIGGPRNQTPSKPSSILAIMEPAVEAVLLGQRDAETLKQGADEVNSLFR